MYAGYTFEAQLTRDPLGPRQRIILDKPAAYASKIDTCYRRHFTARMRSLNRLANAAYEFSSEMKRVLPHLGQKNVKSFSVLSVAEQKEIWDEYLKYWDQPRNLSQITDPLHQDCIIHTLNALLLVEKDNWRAVHAYQISNGERKRKRHLSLAKPIDGIVVSLDPQYVPENKLLAHAVLLQPLEKFENEHYLPVLYKN
ncbi:MAG TPA: hypothetical protein VK158_03245 [Acidobacteriota bacterium]|nr:hypothetical protein [Acidobacteriota bacterium]